MILITKGMLDNLFKELEYFTMWECQSAAVVIFKDKVGFIAAFWSVDSEPRDMRKRSIKCWAKLHHGLEL